LGKANKEDFEYLYKKSKGFIESALINENATLATTSELAGNLTEFNTYITKLTTSIDAIGKASVSAFDSYAVNKANALGLAGISFKPEPSEITAKNIIPKMTAFVTEKSYRGYTDAISNLDPKISEKYPMKHRIDNQEIGRLCNGKNSALDIKKLLDTQSPNEDTDLQDVINYIYILKEAGLVTI
jgi:hypothetical protein